MNKAVFSNLRPFVANCHQLNLIVKPYTRPWSCVVAKLVCAYIDHKKASVHHVMHTYVTP